MHTVVLLMCCFIATVRTEDSVAAQSVAMPVCESKQTCDEIWEASNLSDCIEGTCRCTGDSHYVENRKTCICQEGHVAGSTMCLPVARVEGDGCKEDVQCTTQLGKMAICEANKCYCKRNSTMVDGVCRSKKGLGQSCEYQEECSHIRNADCKQNICTCSGNFVASSNSYTCLSLARNMWDSCEEDIQCASFGDGAHCKSRCICKNAYHQVNNHCVSIKGVGDNCFVPADCYVEGSEENHIDCVDNRCTCSKGYTPSEDRPTCVPGGSTQMSLSQICLFAVTAFQVLRHIP